VPEGHELQRWVREAQEGDRDALERVVRSIQDDVYGLALRFLWHPQDAEDATQDILVRVVTRLAGFRGDSAFRTWVYRIATNALLNLRRGRMEKERWTFEAFGADLDQGLSDDPVALEQPIERALLLEEVRIGCSLGMLLCLERPARLAYILGDILELDHREAALVLEIAPGAFRQRLVRARRAVSDFMLAKCGLVNPANPCRCRRRVGAALAHGRLDPERLLHAPNLQRARAFPEVLEKIRALEEDRRAVALYRAQPAPVGAGDFVDEVRRLIAQHR
jgi:RNA polymerase sigma factor (sigma-70 family)